MKRNLLKALLASTMLVCSLPASAGQAPGAASDPDVPVSHRDRVYAAEQFSNTVSVTDPADNKLVGVIRLGDPQPGNFSPLYKGQVLVHGMGFSPDHKTIAVVSIGSNSVTFIDTATNAVKHTTYVGRAPHEAFFTPDGSEVWVTVRGEDYVSVLDGKTFEEKTRIKTPNGPGMQIFSPDGKYGYVCSSFNPETDVVGGRSPDRRPRQAGKSVLPEHRRDARRQAGLVHPEGYRQDAGLQCTAAVQSDQDLRHRTDHEPRQLRAQCKRHICLRHHRWTERGQGFPY
jgi:YVTN family beta-propeller protein